MSKYTIRIEEDSPSEIDELGSHARIANGIFQLLKHKGGKSIALLGSWGSGKSTVIKLLEDKIDKEKSSSAEEQKIFKFDAWAHQGDPLRRAFLNELIDFLVSVDWLNKDCGKNESDLLNNKTEVIKRESEPIVTTEGRWLIFLLFLVPLGLKLFGSV